MALYFITGVQGSGKSTVLSKLRVHGYEAYDVDEAGPAAAKWQHNTTGFVHPKSSIKAADRTPVFLANHSWKVSRQDVMELARQAENKPVFLGGNVANEAELHDLFANIFALTISDDTLRERLASRTPNDWGTSQHELELSIAANHEIDKQYEASGYMIIDANRPIGVVLHEILEHVS